MTKRVAGYGRVSTLEQAEHGTSAQDQRDRIEGECSKNGWELFKFYSDFGISGARMENRPGIQSLIADARAGKFDTILFTKLDRIGRNQKELLTFWDMITEELHLDLICLDDPSVNTSGRMGRAIRGLLSTFADFEKDLIRERMLGGRKIKWQAGKAFIGRVPFGYRWNKTNQCIEIVPEQANVVRRIAEMYVVEHYDMIGIADQLSRMKVPTPRGDSKRWTIRTISLILGNTAYTGEATYNKNKTQPEIKVKFPPLIDQNTFDEIKLRRESQRCKPRKSHYDLNDKFMTANILFCGHCGGKVSKKVLRGKHTVRTRYCCHWYQSCARVLEYWGKERCILSSTDSDRIDGIIFDKIAQVLANPAQFAKQWLKDFDLEALENQIVELKNKNGVIEKRIDRIINLIVDTDDEELISKYKQRLADNRAEHRHMQSELKRAVEEQSFSQNKVDRFKEFEQALASSDRRGKMKATFKTLGDMLTFLHNLPFAEKKRIVEAVVSPETGGRALLRYPTPLEVCNDETLKGMTPAERVKPLTDCEPLVELLFEIDPDRIENIIKGLKSQHKAGGGGGELLSIDDRIQISPSWAQKYFRLLPRRKISDNLMMIVMMAGPSS